MCIRDRCFVRQFIQCSLSRTDYKSANKLTEWMTAKQLSPNNYGIIYKEDEEKLIYFHRFTQEKREVVNK